ncbi:thiol:disulfide interchange protein [Candidatus Methanoperedens nitroreducens]|uniref:Thiol:disulfide interchange protein n=1 Tax=Candidatus Methanoperedens nitratireducens TaxID=1392998 RepID=A0A062V840_9EURY|nr:thioredoxin family protein [Candidatus Methanoperedens nitroreducens]KCZ71545.1 thiol:disulfide interchange protein [Candidatus Methanoperedens nitroreducens]MDJ1421172.1 thioredoxin family protein [Candidatus Methanoperedens sp.]
MRTKKLISILVMVLIISFAYISYNISLTDFKLSDTNNTYLGGLTWSKSLDKGLQAAQQEDKPVMAYFWAVWCQFCKQFESETLRNPEVNSILREDYILVAMDLDIDKEVARRYGVSFPPHMLFLDASGNVLERIPGAVNADYFLPRLINVRDKMN